MLFEHKANDAKLHDFIISFDSFYQDASAAFGFLAKTEDTTPPKQKLCRQAVLGAREEDPASAMNKSSQTLS